LVFEEEDNNIDNILDFEFDLNSNSVSTISSEEKN
jgi:hypothetical protein